MPSATADHRVESLVGRAHDVDRFIALFRAELSRLPRGGDQATREELEELGDLVRVVEDLWETVSSRTVRLHEDSRLRGLDAQVEEELAAHGERWTRYLSFADAAGIRVPSPAH